MPKKFHIGYVTLITSSNYPRRWSIDLITVNFFYCIVPIWRWPALTINPWVSATMQSIVCCAVTSSQGASSGNIFQGVNYKSPRGCLVFDDSVFKKSVARPSRFGTFPGITRWSYSGSWFQPTPRIGSLRTILPKIARRVRNKRVPCAGRLSSFTLNSNKWRALRNANAARPEYREIILPALCWLGWGSQRLRENHEPPSTPSNKDFYPTNCAGKFAVFRSPWVSRKSCKFILIYRR